MSTDNRTLVENCFSAGRIKSLWTANYFNALPLTPQGFEIGALLPAIIYMSRWGHRRGKGNFQNSFGTRKNLKKLSPTIADVAEKLVTSEVFASSGFEDEIGRAVLGDLYLTWCLENKKHSEGQKEQIQRIFPTHYLASWIDLPDKVASLRGVPELLTGILANQDAGQWIEPGENNVNFSVGVGYEQNPLLAIFAKNMAIKGLASNLPSDTFVETNAQDVGIDELLVIRLAQFCKNAPDKSRGKFLSKEEAGKIPNYHPIAKQAATNLREDLSTFIQIYGQSIPRQSFLQTLEAAIGLGLTNLILSTLNILLQWEKTGKILPKDEQKPCPLFVDASQGQNNDLRKLSERVMSETMISYKRLPYLMMLLRVLDDRAQNDFKIGRTLPASYPDSTEFINLLGDIYKEIHPRSEAILEKLFEDCQFLAEGLENAEIEPEMVNNLRNGNTSPALRFAEAFCDLMGVQSQETNYITALDSALMSDQPNGLAIKRKTTRTENSRRKIFEVRAIVLTSPMLDFLVHRHLYKDSNDQSMQILTFQGFLKILRDQYGLYIDQEPPGQAISQELLRSNKLYLERRLRDLGLLIGVNDAESMKRLKPRYQKGV